MVSSSTRRGALLAAEYADTSDTTRITLLQCANMDLILVSNPQLGPHIYIDIYDCGRMVAVSKLPTPPTCDLLVSSKGRHTASEPLAGQRL